MTGGKKYEPKDAEMLFKELLEHIQQLKQEGIDTTLDYKVDLIIYMEELSVRNFSSNQKTYEKKSSPRALLEQKKEIYYNIFDWKLGQRNALMEMTKSLLKNIVQSNLEDRLTATELMQILRDHEGDVFRNVQALQASIMVDLFAQNTFKEYLKYIEQYEAVIKETLTKRSIECLEEDNRLKKLAKSKMNTVVVKLKNAISETASSGNKDFISALFSNMKDLKKPHNDIEAYKMVTVEDKSQFAATLVTQLTSSIQEQLEKDIDSWEVSSIVREKGFTDFAFNEIVGCTATCPFCKIPCDAHSGGKKSGNHRATVHRSRGLGGAKGTTSKQLTAHNCNKGVASPTAKFRNKRGAWIKLGNYREVYPEWTIEPSTDDERELYWKRVLRDFNEEFARHYEVKKADKVKKANIPDWWYNIQDHHVEENLVTNYGISRDEIRQKLSKTKCKTNE